MTPIDTMCARITGNKPFMMVPWYLMASYLYYVHDIPLLSDTVYDNLCKRLLAEYDELEHVHKDYVEIDQLAAGTGYAIDYEALPTMCKDAALRLAKELDEDKPKKTKRKSKNEVSV